ncbi:SpoIIE family protein phosphatase [Solirubrobacter sp. CPCC 204708]|uniref:histidine kinase n=1 Tax=Solirubrobacter deserti TaxID=2282478 RepID=A0ABT4RDV0_9ACTN|nr:SpoIIE family protein phosphatase [Solirubrobacter deserti]MBE2315963.1 SpoIIE family protein phosphatase [Solirubrobacter deserti]MDA0136714.1 SpoIIE family protein phosphatase [Solirubrobacter deserti]
MAETGNARAALTAGGPVGQDLLAVDWEATPLGPPEQWPRALASIVQVLLTSRFSMWMAWGPELTFFCNDAYRRDTLDKKYPWALGRPAREVWAEIWPDIGPRIEGVLTTGQATWDQALLLFLERSGFVEETYHTFSYSPLAGDDGRVAGMLCVVSEDTERVLSERQLATLRDLGAALSAARDEPEVLAATGRALDGDRRTLPFTLVYLYDEAGEAQPAAHSGEGWSPPEDIWPEAEHAIVVDEIDTLNPPKGAWDQPPVAALTVPLGGLGFLVAGLNRYRALDEGYRGFIELVAGQITAGLSNARAYEEERLRNERLLALDEAKTAFFTNVSHELRTPLTLLLGPAEDALADAEDPLEAEQRVRVERIHRNAQRLLKLVNTLLDFSRLQSGRVNAAYTPTDLARYTAELVSMFESATDRAGLTLTIDTPPLPDPVYVDAEMWAKIVMNLVSNALKFTFTGGITVRLYATERHVELTVTDTGIGIDPADRERLFERFHRVVGARSRSHEGTGVGLALVAELAELHGGTVAVDSTPGEGSTFTVTIPFGAGHLPADQVVSDPAAPTDAGRYAEGFVAEAMRWLDPAESEDGEPVHAGERPRVLVVDDNADMRSYIASLLDSRYAVQTAPDGEVALELARRDPPELVVTDVMMPNLDGFGLLAGLQADPATTDIPVIMVSARAGEEGTIEGLEAGADDYLIKPFTARELLARVHANIELDRARRTRDALRRSGDLLDQAQRLARVGSWEVDLLTNDVTASAEYLRQVGLTAEELQEGGLARAFESVHPDDLERASASITSALESGRLEVEFRLLTAESGTRTVYALGELECDADGVPVRMRGSLQDVTDQRAAEQALAAAHAEREAAARERRIADELQRSLMPQRSFDAEQLEIGAYYRAGVAGTQVGGDWYDVIDLGAGRTALVLGDVIGRGVRAAAVMGQLRAAVRAYAQLELSPADVLEMLDHVVGQLGAEQIVTCLVAIFDPRDCTLTYANAGHLPPLLASPGAPPQRLDESAGPPLGTGAPVFTEATAVLGAATLLALYTDGLVERRDRVIDAGIDQLGTTLAALEGEIGELPDALVHALVPEGSDDDVALLVARVLEAPPQTSATLALDSDLSEIRRARTFTTEALVDWGFSERLRDDALLIAGELVTNAILHGRPPVELRLRRNPDHLRIEVDDGAAGIPRKLRPTPADDHGRGLQLTAAVAHRWGTRPLRDGKSVWCELTLSRYGPLRVTSAK